MIPSLRGTRRRRPGRRAVPGASPLGFRPMRARLAAAVLAHTSEVTARPCSLRTRPRGRGNQPASAQHTLRSTVGTVENLTGVLSAAHAQVA